MVLSDFWSQGKSIKMKCDFFIRLAVQLRDNKDNPIHTYLCLSITYNPANEQHEYH